jgi:hypothetical protein
MTTIMVYGGLQMNCSKCGKKLRIGDEQIGVNEQNIPIIKKFAYCDNCMLRYDLKKDAKKKDSTLSIIALVLSLFTITSFFGVVVGLIDLCMNDKNYRHIGSWFAVIYGILASIVLGGIIIL